MRAYCDELRRYIVDECSVNPGHLASSLGLWAGRRPALCLRHARR
ncbi:MAG: 1-deoxy-D-xylulose-5-phosphate synthase N-terminal domain-containing protein [Alistipes finegoldii]